MKRSMIRTRLVVSLVLAFGTAFVPTAGAQSSPTSFEGHTDLPAYGVIVLPVDREDVAPYVPAGFRAIGLAGETAIAVGLALFENTSFDFDSGTSLREPARFAYSDLAVGTYGPEGSDPDEGGVLYLWRLASAPIFPEAMARLGVNCGGAEPPQTRMCHVPHLTVSVEKSAREISTEVDVPWGFSPYSASASFVPTTLPCAVCVSIPAWHGGSRGLVREDVVWSDFPDTAMIGVGTGTVRAVKGSPLYDILGGREVATGAALLVRAHIDGEFALE